MTLHTLTTFFAAGEPAGGAPVQDLVPAAVVAAVLTAVVLAVGLGHRSGRVNVINRAASLAEKVIPVPGWAALPVLVTLLSLGVAAFGFFWDVATHIDTGRDSGPFANVAHFPILAGLAGVALAGFLAAILGADARDRAAIQWAPGWRIPLGGALLLLCGGLAMIGFPLDDVWHRIFGQDVTLWGPTHVLMIGGASLAPIAAWLLLVEGRCAIGKPGPGRLLVLAWEVQLAGAALIGLSTLQLEFGYGVPQFALAFHPILIALAASIGLVAARIRLGRGGAIAAVGAYLIVIVPMVLIIGPGLGHTFMHFPVYIAEALLVELAALVLRGPVRLGIGAGVLIGTVGVAAEWAWTQIAMPLPWNAALLPEAPLLALAAAVAGGLIGAFIGGALRAPRKPLEMPRFVPAAALAVVIATLAIPMHTETGPPIHASVTLSGHDNVTATVKLDPADAADNAKWFHVMSWQGGGSRRAQLEKIGPATYRTTHTVPVTGDWKTMVRLHTGNSILAMPIYMPGDSAIPAKEIPARPQFERAFQVDHEVLRREERGGAPWLAGAAYGVLGMIALAWLLAIGAAVTRFERRSAVPA
jgi:hypothetical protein